MAKKLKRLLVLCLVLTFSISMIAAPAAAAPGDDNWNSGWNSGWGGGWGGGWGNDYSDQYEWYQVYVQGNLVASGQGAGGNMYYLGTHYTAGINASGPIVTWYITPHGGNAGSFSGTADLRNFITVPDGFTVKDYEIEESSIEGVNSAAGSAYFDNAIIKITIKTIYNEQTGEEIEIPTEPDPTEPEPTEPEPTEPIPVETKVTVNHKYSTYDIYTGQTVLDGTTSNTADAIEGDTYTAAAVTAYNGNVYEQTSVDPAMSITVKADAAENVINIEYIRRIDTTPPNYTPVLDVTKTAVKAEYKEGETVVWTITVKNVSAYPAYNVVVSDDLTGDRWTIAALAPGAEQSFTASLENAPAGVLRNVVVVSWDDGDEIPDEDEPNEPGSTSEEEIVEVKEPENYTPVLTVIKTADKDLYKVGETVTWTITVKNVSAYPAYSVAVSDDLTGDSWTIAALAPGAEQSFTASLENAPAGALKNVVVVSWEDGDEIPDEDEPNETTATSDEEIVEVKEPENYTPVVRVEKTADKAVYEAGETITWTITVRNVSQFTAYDVFVADELTGDSWTVASLAPGEAKSFTAVTEDAVSGSVQNVARVSWTDEDEIPDEEEPNEIKTASDDEIVTVNDPAPENFIPVLDVRKTADKMVYQYGETITWTVTVKNISDHTAYNVVIVDELAEGYWTVNALEPGAEQSFTAVMEHVEAGSVKNVVVVSWDDGDELPDEEEPNEIRQTSDEEVVVVEEPVNYEPILNIKKTADKDVYETGETITWTITVENVGMDSAYGVIVEDDMTGDIWLVKVLEPGEVRVFATTSEAKAAGTVQNVVVVSWEDGDEIADEDEPEEPKNTTDDEIVTVEDPVPPTPPAPPADPEENDPDPQIPDDPDDPGDPDEKDEPEEPHVPAMNQEIDIPDEDVPLANAPETGDIAALWVALSGISAGALALLSKKRKEEE